jgi:hypothetical protein
MFCEIVVAVEESIPAKVYYFMAPRIFRPDFQSYQKTYSKGASCLAENSMTFALIEAQR